MGAYRRLPVRLHRQGGFTLVELMVVVAIIGILSVIGLQSFSSWMVTANLRAAEPYLTQIQTRLKAYQIRTGRYLVPIGPGGQDEQVLEDELGVDLRDADAFCFAVICRDATLCQDAAGAPTTTAADFIAPGDPADPPVEFEVWAILRQADSVDGPGGTTCAVAAQKRPAPGWVAASGRASVGRVVVLRYPRPLDGPDGIGSTYGGFAMDWLNGLSISHAIGSGS